MNYDGILVRITFVFFSFSAGAFASLDVNLPLSMETLTILPLSFMDFVSMSSDPKIK